MKRKKMIIICVIMFVLGVAVAMAVMLGMNNRRAEKESQDNTKYMAQIVIDGIELSIPAKYMATISDEGELTYHKNGYFVMMITVEELCYQYCVDNKEECRTYLENEGLTIQKEFTEISIGGNDYVYAICDGKSSTFATVYKKLDADRCLQALIMGYNIDESNEQTRLRSYEELLVIADSVLCTAKETTKPDTPVGEIFAPGETYDDLQLLDEKNNEEKASMVDASGDILVTHGVTNGYYPIAQDVAKTGYVWVLYENAKVNSPERISVSLMSDNRYETEAYKALSNECDSLGISQSYIMDQEIDGYKYYFITYTKGLDSTADNIGKYNFDAVTKLQDGTIYWVSGCSDTCSDALLPETYADFLMVYEVRE